MSAATWTVDTTTSSLGFSVSYLTVQTVSGKFERWSAELAFDPAAPTTSSIKLTVETDSIKTDSNVRDKQLRGPRFLQVSKFPKMVFESRSVERGPAGRYRVVGDLTIRNEKHEIIVDVRTNPATLEKDATQAKLFARATVPRKKFGVHWNPLFDFVPIFIGFDVHVEGTLSVRRENA